MRGHSTNPAAIEAEIAHLRSLALDALRRHWRVIFGRTPPAELSKDLLGRMIACYSVSGSDLILRVEHSSFPNWTGTEQRRTNVTLTGDELKYTNTYVPKYEMLPAPIALYSSGVPCARLFEAYLGRSPASTLENSDRRAERARRRRLRLWRSGTLLRRRGIFRSIMDGRRLGRGLRLMREEIGLGPTQRRLIELVADEALLAHSITPAQGGLRLRRGRKRSLGVLIALMA
jgi:Lipocalin-like domain